MSKHNKVNKDHYTQRGRLTPDEMARERARAIFVSDTRRKFTAGTKQETKEPRAEPESTPAQSEREEEE
jgi:hypothetical protein